MKDSALDIYIDFLHNHLVFSIGAWEYHDFSVLPENLFEDIIAPISDISQEDALKRLNNLPRYYYKVVYCGKNFSDLEKLQNKAIVFANKLHKKNIEHFNLLINSTKLRLNEFHRRFLEINWCKEKFLWHSELSISFDETYYDYFASFKHEGYKELTQAEYRKISEDLAKLKTSAETVMGIIKKLLDKAVSVGSQEQAEPRPSEVLTKLDDLTAQISSIQDGLDKVTSAIEFRLAINHCHKKGVFSFNLNRKIPEESYESFILLLYPNIIDSGEGELKNLISGKFMTSPNTVKWMLTNHKGETSYRALRYFLESELFESNSNEDVLIEKILFIFADKNGIPLARKNVVEAFRQYNLAKDKIFRSIPKWKKTLDEKIDAILSGANS